MFPQPRHDRRHFFGLAALSLAGAWIGTRDSVMHMITVKPFRLSSASDLASLAGATAWLNSAPLTAADLQGKVVLVDFWTYTCINWLRTLPAGSQTRCSRGPLVLTWGAFAGTALSTTDFGRCAHRE